VIDTCGYSNPFDRHKTIVTNLVGKNGEWVKFPLLPEDAVHLKPTEHGGDGDKYTVEDDNESQRQPDEADYTAFVPKGYCWVHGIDNATSDLAKGTATAAAPGSSESGSTAIEADLDVFDSRRFGPIPIGLVKGVAIRIF